MDTQKNVIVWSEVFGGETQHPRSSEVYYIELSREEGLLTYT